MGVICPGCKIRLKIDKEKHAAKGVMFKCPQCRNVFVLKKLQPYQERKFIWARSLLRIQTLLSCIK